MSLTCIECQQPVTEDEAVPSGWFDDPTHPGCKEHREDLIRKAVEVGTNTQPHDCPSDPSCCSDCSTHAGCHCDGEQDGRRYA